MATPAFIHADMDAFYASVEQLDNPALRGKPVIVGGLHGDRRSVVSTASYEARKFGVHSAMSIAQAARLCPGGVFLRGRMSRYHEKSREVMAVFTEFSPEVTQLSVDEAFLDISGTEKLFGPPENAARKLKNAVKERTGLTVSCGVAANKYLAKVASGLSKPDGLTCVKPGEEAAFMRALPVSKIWGAGAKTQSVFARFGWKTCSDIFSQPLASLEAIFGKSQGLFLYRAVRGEAAADFDRDPQSKSMSAETTFEYDIKDSFALETALLHLCETVHFRLLRSGTAYRTVFIKIRYSDFHTDIARQTSAQPAKTLNEFYERALALFHAKYKAGLSVRLLGVGAGGLENAASEQGSLFTPEDVGDKNTAKNAKIEQALLEINTRYGKNTLRRGR